VISIRNGVWPVGHTKIYHELERRNPWPHVNNRHISISQLLSLWRHSHYGVSCLRRSQPTFSLWRNSHCDVIRYWAGHAHHYGHLATFNI